MPRGWAVGVVMGLWASTPAAAASVPTEPLQTVIFYNARLALRENRPQDVLKLWLLRNHLLDRGEAALHEADFRSAVWTALGSAGLCSDGFPEDRAQDRAEGGEANLPQEADPTGLWPLAQHNWLIETLRRGREPDRPAPFDAFEVGRQQRFISLRDVLSSAEFRSVSFHRGTCLWPFVTAAAHGAWPLVDLKDRLETGRLMQRLIQQGQRTLNPRKVRNLAVLEARLFDLELALTELQARRARKEGSAAARRSKALGMNEVASTEAGEAAARWPEGSPQALLLRRSLSWPAADWLSLSPQRRLFLFDHARRFSEDPAHLLALQLQIIDGLIDAKAGGEVEAWLGFLGLEKALHRRGEVIGGERGKRLLELDRSSGFRERGVIALHRGVAFLEAGERLQALRSFAYAMQTSEESRSSAILLPLARRWVSNVLSRYETTPEVISTLRALIPRAEYNATIQDLVWRAALRADAASFALLTRDFERGGRFEAQVRRLRPLAEGRAGELLTALRDGFAKEPYSTVRFSGQLVEQLESEEAEVRRANVPLITRLSELLTEASETKTAPEAQRRGAEELLQRTQAILAGLDALELEVRGEPRQHSPGVRTFAGSVRLAPSDPLPWPFQAPETSAPSAFTPLLLVPVEWRGERGELVFGWRLTE